MAESCRVCNALSQELNALLRSRATLSKQELESVGRAIKACTDCADGLLRQGQMGSIAQRYREQAQALAAFTDPVCKDWRDYLAQLLAKVNQTTQIDRDDLDFGETKRQISAAYAKEAAAYLRRGDAHCQDATRRKNALLLADFLDRLYSGGGGQFTEEEIADELELLEEQRAAREEFEELERVHNIENELAALKVAAEPITSRTAVAMYK